jgi:hypothetical protein
MRLSLARGFLFFFPNYVSVRLSGKNQNELYSASSINYRKVIKTVGCTCRSEYGALFYRSAWILMLGYFEPRP